LYKGENSNGKGKDMSIVKAGKERKAAPALAVRKKEKENWTSIW